jgi:rare lipoprotein A (peptidoglycan hydrolase)
MPMFRHGRHGAAAGLLVTGTMLLVAVQQVIGGVAAAQTEAVMDVHNLQPLPEAIAPVAATTVDAAVVNGQFEELVKPTPVPTPAPTVAPTVVPTPEAKPLVFEKGIASTYGEGDGFEGNRTACGQIFHTRVVQIAHKSLPCGTMVRVEDADTGRSVDAEVTDRGPYVPGRIVDLSWGAFKQLDPDGPGLLRVTVYLLNQ